MFIQKIKTVIYCFLSPKLIENICDKHFTLSKNETIYVIKCTDLRRYCLHDQWFVTQSFDLSASTFYILIISSTHNFHLHLLIVCPWFLFLSFSFFFFQSYLCHHFVNWPVCSTLINCACWLLFSQQNPQVVSSLFLSLFSSFK